MPTETVVIYVNEVRVIRANDGKCLARWICNGTEGIRSATDEAFKLYPKAAVKGVMP